MEVDWVRVYSGEDPSGVVAIEPNASAPTPTEDSATVISLFSDAYDDIAGIDYNPNWGQGTAVTIAQIAGNQMLRYANLDYQGTDFAGNPQDVSDKGFLHLDFWTADSTALNVYLISAGPVETPYSLTGDIAPNSWVSVDIPLTEFAGVDLTNLIQLKFDGNGTIFLDNLYFAGEAPIPATGGVIPAATVIAADGSAPDLVPGGYDAFGSGAVIVTDFAGDSSYGNALAVTTGPGYGGGILAQVGITGFAAGFAAPYDEFVFKVKGLVDDTIVIKIEPGGIPFLTVDLSAPPAGVTVTDLGDGWSQVEIPLAQFGDVSAATQIVFETTAGAQVDNYTIYLTDVGFSTAGATGGVIPAAAVIAADGSAPDLVPGGYDAFGSGAVIVTDFAGDSSYGNALAVTTGPGYGGGILAQVGITGFAAGFAAPYDEFVFKVKGLVDDTIVIKIEPGGIPFLTVDLSAPPAGVTVTDLGDGWSQVEIPLAQFGDVSAATQIVFETTAGAQVDNYTIYLTDVGFSTAGATGGVIPAAAVIAADGSAPDLVPGGYDAFGSGAVIVTDFAGDSSYGNALAVTTGPGYGGGILAQVGITGFAAGFAAPYDEFVFKVKGLVDDTIVIKIEPGGIPFLTVDLSAPPAGVTVTDLGDGWSQVEIPLAQFGDVSAATQIVFETTAGAQVDNYTDLPDGCWL